MDQAVKVHGRLVDFKEATQQKRDERQLVSGLLTFGHSGRLSLDSPCSRSFTWPRYNNTTMVSSVRSSKREKERANLPEKLDFLSESVEIEIISDVVFVDLNEELVAFEVAEPGNPSSSRLAVIVVV